MNLVLREGLKAGVAFVETNIVIIIRILILSVVFVIYSVMHLMFGFEQVNFDILEGSQITAMKLGKILEGHGILLMPDSSSRCVTI